MAEQNLNRGIELHSKAQALSVAFPLGGRGATFPPSIPSVFTSSPCTPRFWSSPVPPLALDLQTTKLPPSVALPRGAHSALPFLSFFLYLSFSLSGGERGRDSFSLSYSFFPATPFSIPGRSTSSAAVRGRSCRFLKCKYQSRNKRQRLAVQDESIVSA